MDAVTLQVPLSKSLRDRAASHFAKQGYSSLQEAIRVFLAQAADKQIKVTFAQPIVLLSPKTAKRYDRMLKDIETGKVKLQTAHSVDELMAQLNAG